MYPHKVLIGSLNVALPPNEAIQLFTSDGERLWVAGWDPHYPAGVPDQPDPGTVWITGPPGSHTTWVVVDREADAMRYARVAPATAGTVSVTCRPASTEGHTTVQVQYALTALSADGADELSDMAASYESFLAGWEQAIHEHLDGSGAAHAGTAQH
jgi:hypothetical protein